MTCIYEIYVANIHSHTYVCFRLNKMAAMVIDKFHSLSAVLFPVIVRHFAYTLKEIDDALKDLNLDRVGVEETHSQSD